MAQSVVVGLTGQTGAGKTTVSDALRNEDFFVIDADLVARQVVEAGSNCIMDIVLAFGCQFLNENGTLNRRRLGREVFGNKKKLKKLNSIMFPYIIDAIKQEIEKGKKAGSTVIVLDAPTLFESGADTFCDIVVSVIASEPIRLHRIMSRDSLNEVEALNRIHAQHNDEYYTSRSWKVINNSTELESLNRQINKLILDIRTYNCCKEHETT